MDRIIGFIIALPIFLFALTFHEYAHGWVAWKRGDWTAKSMGRLTLNPLAHLDPLGTLFFVLSFLAGFGFGWAKPVPVNYWNLRNPVKDMMVVAAAGPAANLLQAGVWWVVLWLVWSNLGGFSSDPVGLVMGLGSLGIRINLFLAAFNLIPIPPLDGSRILMGLLPREQAAALSRLEPMGFMLLMLAIWAGLLQLLAGPVFAVYHAMMSPFAGRMLF